MPQSEPLVSLQRGFVVPLAVFDLVLHCENAGVRLQVAWVRGAEVVKAEGPLTPELLEQLRRWKPHILAILKYTASDAHLFDSRQARPDVGPLVKGAYGP